MEAKLQRLENDIVEARNIVDDIICKKHRTEFYKKKYGSNVERMLGGLSPMEQIASAMLASNNKTQSFKEEQPMSIKKVTYVNGSDVNHMTEGQLVDARNGELSSVKAKKAYIEHLQSTITQYKDEIAKHNESAKELKAIISDRQSK